MALVLGCAPLRNAQVKIALLDGEAVEASANYAASDIGQLVAMLLDAARNSSEASGVRVSDPDRDLEGVVTIQPSATSLSPGPGPNTLTVIVHSGLARTAIQLTETSARELGEALLAATADEGRPQ